MSSLKKFGGTSTQSISIALLALMINPLLITSCTLVDIRDDKTVHYHGMAMNKDVLAEVKIGETDSMWLQKNLGYPSEIITGDNGEQRYVYIFEEKSVKQSKIFLFFRYRSTKTVPMKMIVTCKEGVVTHIEEV